MKKNKTPQTDGQMVAIHTACIELAGQRNELQSLLAEIQKEQLAVSLKYADRLRSRVALFASGKGLVTGLVLKARALFMKPKSRTFEGVVVGFEKERDTVEMPE